MNELEAMSTWDRLWPLLVTATLTLAAAVAVQLLFVPRVERRKRSEQRWEEHVAALGELLTIDLPNVARDYSFALRTVVWANDPPDGVDVTQWNDLQRRAKIELDSTREKLEHIKARTTWLTNRVAPGKTVPNGGAGGPVWMATQRVVVLDGVEALDPMYSTRVATEDLIEQARDEWRANLAILVDAVEELSEKGPPKPASWRRRTLFRFRRWAAAQKANRSSGSSDSQLASDESSPSEHMGETPGSHIRAD